MPIDYSKYPPNWKTEIVPAVLERAGLSLSYQNTYLRAELDKKNKLIADQLLKIRELKAQLTGCNAGAIRISELLILPYL